MYELALFAGAGGGILGGKILGWRTVCAVEIEKYPRGVLMRRQDDGALHPFPVWDDITTFRVDNPDCGYFIDDLRAIADNLVISGGFPCQDISVAGKGKGLDGERSGLWGEMWRLVCEIRPAVVYVENSPMLTSRGIDRVLGQLSEVGYDAVWGVLGADDLGANHKRERIWIVAYTKDNRQECRQADNRRHEGQLYQGKQGRDKANGCEPVGCSGKVPDTNKKRSYWSRQRAKQARRGKPANSSSNIPNPHSERELQQEGSEQNERRRIGNSSEDASHTRRTGCEEQHAPDLAARSGQHTGHVVEGARGAWWATEPGLGRVVNGMADRVDRLKTIGNGQVPAVAAGAFAILSTIIEQRNITINA